MNTISCWAVAFVVAHAHIDPSWVGVAGFNLLYKVSVIVRVIM